MRTPIRDRLNISSPIAREYDEVLSLVVHVQDWTDVHRLDNVGRMAGTYIKEHGIDVARRSDNIDITGDTNDAYVAFETPRRAFWWEDIKLVQESLEDEYEGADVNVYVTSIHYDNHDDIKEMVQRYK